MNRKHQQPCIWKKCGKDEGVSLGCVLLIIFLLCLGGCISCGCSGCGVRFSINEKE